MKSTVINTSKEMTAYTDYPPPAEDPNYMHNRRNCLLNFFITLQFFSGLKEYFCEYADKFGLKDCIKFNHRVLNIERAQDYKETSKWVVHYTDKQVFD
jgi:dimethylaniline monooxygenase (N-oxide forming)